MKGISRFFTLKAKIMLIVIFFGLLPAMLFFGILFANYTKALQQQTDRLVHYAMSQTARNVSHETGVVSDLFVSVLLNTELTNMLHQYNRGTGDQTSLKYQIQSVLSAYIANEPRIDTLVFIREDLDYILFNRKYQMLASESIWNDGDVRRAVMDSLRYKELPTRVEELYVFSSREYLPGEGGEPSLYFAFPIYDLVTRNNYGILVAELSNAVFENVFMLDDPQEGLHMMAETRNYLVNEEGKVVSGVDWEAVGMPLEALATSGDGGYTARSYPVNGTSMTLVSFFNRNALQEEVSRFQHMMMPLPLATAALLIFVVYLTGKRYRENINLVATGLQSFSQVDEEITIDMKPTDEMFIIVEQFNLMQRRIQQLVGELREKNVHIARTTDQRRRAEIKALQAQINPHFLYNTLDAINWTAISRGQTEISTMLSALASLLRYSISNIDIVVTLEAEVLWLQKYVYLQSRRFCREIRLFLDLEEDRGTLGFPIHKMLLQPLVENAMMHAFDMSVEKEQWVRLTAHIQEDGRLVLRLVDNGRGIEEDTLSWINCRIAFGEAAEEDGVGLSNVIQRIRLYHGGDASLRVESAVGEGTVITMVIPDCSEQGVYGGGEL